MYQKLINSYLSVLCPLCNKHGNIITDQNSGELICTTCGSVIIDNTEATRSEWTSSNIQDSDFRDRTGAPTSLAKYDRGLSTVIGKIDKDASGRQIDLAMKSRIGRWRTWDARSQTKDPSKRNLQTAFIQLYTMKDVLGLPESAVEKVAYLYRKIQERKLIKGRTIKGALAVASYIACRELGISRTLKEIAKISNLKEKELARIYRKVMFELDLKVPQVDALKEIIKIGNICGISERAKRRAIKVMMTVMKTGISAGKNPMGLAGAVLYLSCKEYNEEITQSKIARVAGVTEVTLRHDLDIILELTQTMPSIKTNV
ncbi:transcription initiation factor IIB [Candidatus Nitrosocosmicus arcticus]|uniref:transcription initiation factor IIB n=1 Tax=Candidatus Nitrosocosmicus arcticus TaxID=2035267 RepID=UPI0021BD9286|nr:transcription initiation factor IIB [Candidatus Nitrosocosmicus arcticus]